MADKKDDEKRPIIKKVKKVQGGGHHGGAWKVAYADFVTAMMAFFLLLWLLSTSSKATLTGLAEFFTPTIGLKDSQGIGFKGGQTASENAIAKSNTSEPGVVAGRAPTGAVPENQENAAPNEGNKEDNLFKEGATALRQAFSTDKAVAQYNNNISIEQTPEGLKINLMDSDKYAMFDANSAELTEHGRAILSRMVGVLKKMPNYVTLTGHTDASPVEAGREGYSNWELSTDRANAARRFLVQSGLEAERPKKVVGMAATELLIPAEPRNPRNRRISIILMKGSHILIPESAVPDKTTPEGAPEKK